jgi:hypothetical protein
MSQPVRRECSRADRAPLCSALVVINTMPAPKSIENSLMNFWPASTWLSVQTQ